MHILPQPVYFTSLRNCHTHRDRKILWTRRAYAHTNMAVALPLLRVNKLNSSVIILCHCVPCSNLQATSQCKQALLSFDKIALLISRRKKTYFTLMHFLFHFLYPPPKKKKRGGILDSQCLSVCLSVCPSVLMSVYLIMSAQYLLSRSTNLIESLRTLYLLYH